MFEEDIDDLDPIEDNEFIDEACSGNMNTDNENVFSGIKDANLPSEDDHFEGSLKHD